MRNSGLHQNFLNLRNRSISWRLNFFVISSIYFSAQQFQNVNDIFKEVFNVQEGHEHFFVFIVWLVCWHCLDFVCEYLNKLDQILVGWKHVSDISDCFISNFHYDETVFRKTLNFFEINLLNFLFEVFFNDWQIDIYRDGFSSLKFHALSATKIDQSLRFKASTLYFLLGLNLDPYSFVVLLSADIQTNLEIFTTINCCL